VNTACSVQASACTSQDLLFQYTVFIEEIKTGVDGETIGGLRKGTSCRVPASLVPNSDVGYSQTYEYPSECTNTGSTYNEGSSVSPYRHVATCGTSGWELQSSPILIGSCVDGGTVVEVRSGFAQEAQSLIQEPRCSCGAAFVGGPYGRNVTCVDRPGGILI